MKNKYNLKWRKLPSVTPGGKKYFYNANGKNGELFTVVWDRIKQSNALQINGLLLGFAPDVVQAKRYFENRNEGKEVYKVKGITLLTPAAREYCASRGIKCL